MKSLLQVIGYLTVFLLLLAGALLFVENQDLRHQLNMLQGANRHKENLIVQMNDSIVVLRSANNDLSNSFIAASKELKSCAKIKMILKEQSLLIRMLQEHNIRYEANAETSENIGQIGHQLSTADVH